MNKNGTKNSILISIIKSIPFIVVWVNIFYICYIIDGEGTMSVYKDSFGTYIYVIGVICIVIVFCSIFYLRYFIKKEWIIQLIAFMLTFIFLIGSYVLLQVGDSKFVDFSTEKWIKYPQRRLTMYFDLVEKYDINGYSMSQIESLLGKPDDIKIKSLKHGIEKIIYIYSDLHNNSVYVYFENGKATYFNYSE